MIGALWPLIRPALHRLDPETAHRATLAALERAPRRAPPAPDPRLATEAFGLSFPNPIGLAAGFDKDARAPDAMLALGFGFVEIGSVTPRPQAGNPRPRLFRLPADRAIVNRMGFNNDGASAALERLKRRAGRPGLVGVNVGANKDSADRTADYVAGITTFAPLAAFFTVNISSPNTPGLRDLQAKAALDDLVSRVLDARDAAAQSAPRRPVLLKIAPDLDLAELDDVVAVARGRGLDGLVVANTTLSRAGLRDPRAIEAGGMSGAPLFRRATWMLAETSLRIEGAMPLVGVGGVASGADALAKIRAGATLIELYSALVYEGPDLVARIAAELSAAAGREGAARLSTLVGRDAEAAARAGPGG